MRYIGSGRASTREQIDGIMRRLPRAYALYPGLGTWCATRRDNGDWILKGTKTFISGVDGDCDGLNLPNPASVSFWTQAA